MLNGDVLTDIDLTAQLAQHERTGARATLALVPVEDPSAYGLVRRDADGERARVPREAEPRPDRHEPRSTPAPTCCTATCSRTCPRGQHVSIEREVFPTLVGDGLYGYEAPATGSTSARPSATCRRRTTSSTARCKTTRHRRLRRRAPRASPTAPQLDGRVVGPALVGAGARVADGRARDRAQRARPRRRGRPRARTSTARSCSTAPSSARTRTLTHCIVGPGARVGAHCRLGEGVVLGEGVTLGADNQLAAGARLSPNVSLPDGAIRFLSEPSHPSPARRSTRSTPPSRSTTSSALPEHLRDALWRVESAKLEPHDAPGGLIVAGMGGSAIGGALARAALGDRASRPIIVMRDYGVPSWTTPDATVLCASYSGNTEETLAAFEAAGALGARRDRRDDRRQAGRRRARGGRAGDPAAGRLPAARRGRLHARDRARGRRRLRRRASRCTRRSTSPPRTREALVAEWGPDGAEDALPKQLARGLHGTIPQIAGAGLTAPIAYRWKTQLNENAKIPAFSARAARARPQRDRRLGGRGRARAASAPSSSTTPTCIRASASGSS